jgi:transcription elongation factor GreB
MVVVDQAPNDVSRVFFGAWVKVEDDTGVARCVRVVGPDEFDMHAQYISMDSPLGRALLRKAVDDELSVELPEGSRTFVVLEIAYGEQPWG